MVPKMIFKALQAMIFFDAIAIAECTDCGAKRGAGRRGLRLLGVRRLWYRYQSAGHPRIDLGHRSHQCSQ